MDFSQGGFFEYEARDEARKDFNYQRSEGVHEEGRMRRVPDFLPVCMQDFLYRRKSELRAVEVSGYEFIRTEKTIHKQRSQVAAYLLSFAILRGFFCDTPI